MSEDEAMDIMKNFDLKEKIKCFQKYQVVFQEILIVKKTNRNKLTEKAQNRYYQ